MPDFLTELLELGRLDGLNGAAHSGLRLSEIANLQEQAIHFDADIKYVEVLPEGRVLKTQDSKREMPLVGVALAAMKLHPKGFPRHRDRSSSLSALLNKYLKNAGLRPTKDHTVYSLRHSFKDLLIAAEAPDSLIDNLMGHRRPGPRYGKGAPLELKLKYLESIAVTPPARL
jgi:integrase